MRSTNFAIISDFNLRSNNRGTAALGYGAISFLLQNHFIDENYEFINYRFYINPFHARPKEQIHELDVNGKVWRWHILYVSLFEKLLYKWRILFFRSRFKDTIRNVKIIAALNGGDGLTDIYGDTLLNSRLSEMKLAIDFQIPFLIMPQTIGPFINENNKNKIVSLLKKSSQVYVRDDNFVDELKKNGIPYIKTKDLSFFMQPQSFDVDIHKPSIGLNISGLAYSNSFGNLKGQFVCYPKLMEELVSRFRELGCNIYIIPHSYNLNVPESYNDDMEVSRLFYEGLANKENIYIIDNDLISPQLKYLISRMDFFIGTRMHANFAAIFTGTPVFGLAYSYKFKSAFENNGIYNRIIEINNLTEDQVENVVKTIEQAYLEDVLLKRN